MITLRWENLLLSIDITYVPLWPFTSEWAKIEGVFLQLPSLHLHSHELTSTPSLCSSLTIERCHLVKVFPTYYRSTIQTNHFSNKQSHMKSYSTMPIFQQPTYILVYITHLTPRNFKIYTLVSSLSVSATLHPPNHPHVRLPFATSTIPSTPSHIRHCCERATRNKAA